jgi:hypothetical protein
MALFSQAFGPGTSPNGENRAYELPAALRSAATAGVRASPPQCGNRAAGAAKTADRRERGKLRIGVRDPPGLRHAAAGL